MNHTGKPESHYVWGRRYLMRVMEADTVPTGKLLPSRIELHVRPGTDLARRAALLAAWYREQIRSAVPALLDKWQPLVGVEPRRILVQRMKTRCGTCNPASGCIRLNRISTANRGHAWNTFWCMNSCT